jgi:hypothetical protein
VCASSRRAPLLVAVTCAAAIATAGCGPDVRRERAERSVRLASRALLLVERTSGGEEAGEEVAQARADGERWLARTEAAVDVWPGAGSMAYETMAPCLARSLGRLRERLARHRRPIPESLREAEALARTATDMRCATRRRALAD